MTNLVLLLTEDTSDVAHPWGTKALLASQKRSDRLPQMLLLHVEAHLMPRKPNPGPIDLDPIPSDKRLQCGPEGRCRQARLTLETQALQTHALEIGIVPVEHIKDTDHTSFEGLPTLLSQCKKRTSGGEAYQAKAGSNFDRGGKRHGPVPGECRDVEIIRVDRRETFHGIGRIGLRLTRNLRTAIVPTPMACRRPQVDEKAAADGSLSRCIPQYESIVGRSGDGAVEDELDHLPLTGLNGVVFQQNNPCPNFCGCVMQADWKPLADRLFLAWKDVQACIDPVGRYVKLGSKHHVASDDAVLGNSLARQIEGTSLP
jgi:hypothetical protein